jgi:HK97 family phage prohead protease
VDSYGTILPVDKWDLKRYERNGIVGYMHDVYGESWTKSADPDDIIGKGEAFVEDEKLIVRITFEPKELNERADKIFRKVQFGTLNAVSVGFVPTAKGHKGNEERGENPDVYYYNGQELLEVSVVNIPANPNAVRVKGLDSSEEEMRELLSREEPETRETAPETPGTQPEPEIPDTPETPEAPETPSEGFDPLELQRELTVAEATSLI